MIQKTLCGLPAKGDWTHLQKYSQRVKNFKYDPSEDKLIILVLQFRGLSGPLFPRLNRFELVKPTEGLSPFINSFLSLETTEIEITFSGDLMGRASFIRKLPKLCPKLKSITLNGLSMDPDVTNATSEMLLACNHNILQVLLVDSPLTKEALKVACKLPKLTKFGTVIWGRTLLPPVVLPNLTWIDIDFDDHLDWLPGFCGAMFGKLKSVSFRSGCRQNGDFLGEFEKVVRATPVQDTLSAFMFYTSHPWNPNYSALLSFKQLQTLEIEFNCRDGCSSTVDDDVITNIADAMPKLKVLKLGAEPCQKPGTGPTANGLIVLATHCPDLRKLRIHFHAGSLSHVAAVPSNDEQVLKWEGCALTDLEVGSIPIAPRSEQMVIFVLLQVFPRILNITYTNRSWKAIADGVKKFRQVGNLVCRRGKAHHNIQYSLS